MQITSDRDRVPRARCPRRRVEKIAREESTTTSGAAEGDEEDEMNRAGKRGRKRRSETVRDVNVYTAEKRERTRACTHMRMYTRGGKDSPHCDCYTHGRNVPPVCRLMPTRNQTRADSSYCSLSSQQRSNRLHNLPPALLFAARHTCHTYTRAAHGRTYSLYEQSTKAEKEREKEGKEREEGELNHG